MQNNSISKNKVLTPLTFVSIVAIFAIILFLGNHLTNNFLAPDNSAAATTPCLLGGSTTPYCGSNNTNYFNSCIAKNDGVAIDCQGKCPCADVAYFQYSTGSDTAILKLTGKLNITQARALIKNKCYDTPAKGVILPSLCSTQKILTTVVPQLKGSAYNSPWHFITEPYTTTFQSYNIELCDTNIKGVEAAALGGKEVSPGGRWCPWSFKLLKEVTF